MIEVGAFDAFTSNRRAALWEAALSIQSGRNVQRAFPVSGPGPPPRFDDLSDHDEMSGDCKVLDIYSQGHVMGFIRATLDADVLTTVDSYQAEDGERIRVAAE